MPLHTVTYHAVKYTPHRDPVGILVCMAIAPLHAVTRRLRRYTPLCRIFNRVRGEGVRGKAGERERERERERGGGERERERERE